MYLSDIERRKRDLVCYHCVNEGLLVSDLEKIYLHIAFLTFLQQKSNQFFLNFRMCNRDHDVSIHVLESIFRATFCESSQKHHFQPE